MMPIARMGACGKRSGVVSVFGSVDGLRCGWSESLVGKTGARRE